MPYRLGLSELKMETYNRRYIIGLIYGWLTAAKQFRTTLGSAASFAISLN